MLRPCGIYIDRKRGGKQVAQRVSVTYACDYDDKEIPAGQQRSITFGIDGQEYEIDLCARHSERLSEAVGKFAEHARKATVRRPKRRRRTTANRQRSAEIRAWAKSSGIEVSDRGRIPGHVLAGFESSHRRG
jgi:Lsr2